MSAAKYALHADQGETFRAHFTYQDSAGTPINLAGATARMQVRDGYGAAAALFNLTTENGGIALGGVAGTVDLYIASASLATLVVPDAPGPRPTKDCVYDLELNFSGEVVPLLYGPFAIARRVLA